MRKFLIALAILLSSKMVFSQDVKQYYWEMPNQYGQSMTIVASLYIDGEEQQNEYLELGVFCGDEPRGRALPVESVITHKLVYNLTVKADDDGDNLTFKFYDHLSQTISSLDCNQSLKFVGDGIVGGAVNPYVVNFVSTAKFIGNGSWYEASNWKSGSVPALGEDVIIAGKAVIPQEGVINVNGLEIESGDLTIEGSLTVAGTITNSDVDALIIADGGQLFQNNDGVLGTFRKNIVNPTGVWGSNDKTGWQFISSPIKNVSVLDFIPEEGDYDLFSFDGAADSQWVNYKNSRKYTFKKENSHPDILYDDHDGDGKCWEWTRNGKSDGFMSSYAYDENEEELIYPENYMILPRTKIVEGVKFTFKVMVEDVESPETCSVCVATEISGLFNESAIVETFENLTNTAWSEKIVDLSAFKGENVYIAFVHHNTYNGYILHIDDIFLTREGAEFNVCTAYLASYELSKYAEFKGELNRETSYSVNVPYDKDSQAKWSNFHLLGNPFTYDLDLEKDIKTKALNEGFAIITEDGGYEYRTNGVINAGAGFMVYAKSYKTRTVTFQKGINVQRDNTESRYINVEVSNSTGSDNVIVDFSDSDEEEREGFLKLPNFNDEIALIYAKQNNDKYAIINCDESVNEVPLHFDAKKLGNYTLNFDVKGDFESVYLIDNMAGERVNVLIEKEYTFTATANDNTKRFTLVFDNNQQSPENVQFVYQAGEELIVEAEGLVQIIDLMGRVIYSKDVRNTNNRIDVSNFNSAAYVVRCIGESEILVQKMVIK